MPSSNFWISTHVPDVEDMFVWGEILTDLVFFFQLSMLFLGSLYFVAVGEQVALKPLEGIDARKRVCGNVLQPVDYVHNKQHRYSTE